MTRTSQNPPAPLKPAHYTIVRDTREKDGHGWWYTAGGKCLGTVRKTLKTGDYTIEGLESIITIDRKASSSELANNLMSKRFENELVRMSSFKYAAIVMEFDFEDLAKWPDGSGIPKYKWASMKLNAASLIARFWKLSLKYPYVHWIFAGRHAKSATHSLLKRAFETYGNQSKKRV